MYINSISFVLYVQHHVLHVGILYKRKHKKFILYFHFYIPCGGFGKHIMNYVSYFHVLTLSFIMYKYVHCVYVPIYFETSTQTFWFI